MSPETAKETQTESVTRLTVWQYLQSQNQFNGLFEIKLPFALRFALKQIKNELLPQLESYEETRKELLQNYGADEKGAIKEDSRAEFNQEFAALAGKSLTLNSEKIPESEFGDNLSVSDVEQLKWLIQEGI